MPTFNPPKPKKRWFQKGAVQGAVIGAVLAAALGTAQLVYFRGASAPERHTPPPKDSTSSRGATSEPPATSPPSQPSGPSISASSPSSAGPNQSGSAEKRLNPPQGVATPPTAPDRLLELRELEPLTFRSLGATVSLEFRETLGSHYAELTVSTPGQPPIRCAARNPGARCEFQTGDTTATIDVVSMDRARRTAKIILRSDTPN